MNAQETRYLDFENICRALVDIVGWENRCYGHKEEVLKAKEYIKFFDELRELQRRIIND